MTIITNRKHITIDFRKMFSTLFYTAVILFIAWLAISYINIICHNLNPDYVYPSWNIIVHGLERLAEHVAF